MVLHYAHLCAAAGGVGTLLHSEVHFGKIGFKIAADALVNETQIAAGYALPGRASRWCRCKRPEHRSPMA